MPQNNPPEDVQARLKYYQEVVKQYEALDAQIDALMTRNKGASKNMSAPDRALYHDLARQRDDLHHEMQIIENELFDEDDASIPPPA